MKIYLAFALCEVLHWALRASQVAVHSKEPARQCRGHKRHWSEDALEEGMATHSSILAWRIPWSEELGGLQSTGRKELETTERLHFHSACKLNKQGDTI